MLYAIISDIHSNLEALEVALKRIDEIKVDEILCLGDIVGYNANPNECVEIIRERGIKAIIGNHDRASSGISEPDNFNKYAKDAVFWTRGELTKVNSDYLKSLKENFNFEKRFLLVHGSPRDPDEYIYTARLAGENLKYLENNFEDISICFFGHTHVKALYYLQERHGIASETKEGITLSSNDKFLVNPGSVGQPRDGDIRGSFIIFDSEKRLIKFEPVSYNIEKTASKVIKAGLPKYLAERLFLGR